MPHDIYKDNGGGTARIPPHAFEAATGVLFAVAMIAYVCRLYIQLGIHKRFPAEDWILLFAVIVLIGSTALGYILFPGFVRNIELSLGKVHPDYDTDLAQAKLSREGNAIDTIWSFILYPVKLAYLVFFRKLITRFKILKRYWWFVTGLTLVSLPASAGSYWAICSYRSTQDLASKCSGIDESRRAFKVTLATAVIDVVTDILIASIPICLLWEVRIATRQKVGLGMTLCLSLVIAIIALIRVGGIYLPGRRVDVVWFSFWQQNECNIAVWMVSMTAFRSFFATNDEQNGQQERFGWMTSVRKSLRRKISKVFPKLFKYDSEEPGSLYENEIPTQQSDRAIIHSREPVIPAATVTGARTAIDRVGRSHAEPDTYGTKVPQVHVA